MNISQESYDHYWTSGWVTIEGVFTSHEMDRITQLALQVSSREMNQGKSSTDTIDYTQAGEVAPRKVNYPFDKGTAFRSCVLDPRLSKIIRDLIGVNPVLFTDQIFMKPPHCGTPKPYHQDNFYFRCKPADHVITAWIAMDDADEENGCLRYIEGSHRGPVLSHQAPDPEQAHNLVPPSELIDLSKEVLAEVKKGGVVFHHSKLLHTSHRNQSDRWRRAYASHWASTETTSENETISEAYFKREDYPRN